MNQRAFYCCSKLHSTGGKALWKEWSRVWGFSCLINYKEVGCRGSSAALLPALVGKAEGWCGSTLWNLFHDPPGSLQTHMSKSRWHMHPLTWTTITRLHRDASQVLVNRHSTGQLQQALLGLFSHEYLPIYPWNWEWAAAGKNKHIPLWEVQLFLQLFNQNRCWENCGEREKSFGFRLLVVIFVWARAAQAVCWGPATSVNFWKRAVFQSTAA